MKDIRVPPIKLKKKSRSSEFASWSADGNSILDELIRATYLAVLFIVDLLVFVYFANASIFEGKEISKAFLYCCGGIFAVSLVLVLLLSFSKMWQNIVCAILTGFMFVVFCNQFLLFDIEEEFTNYIILNARWLKFLTGISVYWYLGLLVALFVYILFYSIYGTIFATVVLILVSLVGVSNSEIKSKNHSEYLTVKQITRKQEISKDKDLIYFILPKFPSYQFLDSVNNDDFKELKNLMMGFFALNGFEVYSNAFIAKPDIVNNIAEIYNQVDYLNPKGIDRGFAEYVNNWEFLRGGLTLASLEDNKLYAHLKERGYIISTYPMPEFNLCYTRDVINTDRCVVKNYQRTSLYNKKVSVENNVYALLAEWMDSFNLKVFNPIVRSLADKSWLKNMKVLSRNRRLAIEGSAEVFNQLRYDISRDEVGHVYMVYVDLPSVAYVYDEFCNIKPRDKWIALSDNNIYAGGINEKRKAYADQTKCLIGKMQFFLDELRDINKLERSDIILQGVTGVRELTDMKVGKYANFVVDNLVGMGIRKGKQAEFLINSEICLASDISKSHIKNGNYCYSIDHMKLSNEELEPLKNSLIKNSYIKKHKLNNIIENYKDWYSLFEKRTIKSAKLKKYREELREKIKTKRIKRKKVVKKVIEDKKVEPVKEKVEETIEDLEDIFEKDEEINELINNGELLVDRDMFEYIVGDDGNSSKGVRKGAKLRNLENYNSINDYRYLEGMVENNHGDETSSEYYLNEDSLDEEYLDEDVEIEEVVEDIGEEVGLENVEVNDTKIEQEIEEEAKVIDISDSVEINFEEDPLENVFK